MKKKKKNGFVFVETIVVCSVVAISLVSIYASFAVLLQEQKKRNKYDQAVYNYRMYTMAKYLHDKSDMNSCNDYTDVKNKVSSFSALLSPNNLYYVRADKISNVPDSDTAMYLDEYVKTITTENDNACLLIGEFKINADAADSGKDEYYYSHVVIDKE